MTNAGPAQGPIAAVFDLTVPASQEALRKVVGEENVAQFVEPGKPFVVLVYDRGDGEFARLAFEGEAQLRDFYLATLRTNVKLAPGRRVQFVLRDLDPRFEADLRQATSALALELLGPQGSA